MKKILLSIALIAGSLTGFAQNTAKDVFSKDDIVWYGLDFSKSKMIGQFDQGAGAAPASGSDLRSKYFPGWNMLILNEPEKYNIKATFRKTNVFNDLSVVEKNNAKVDPDNLMSYNDYKFDKPADVVSNVISGYSGGDKKDGIGLVFVVEYFNKTEQKASVYVTFFDIATKKVLFTEHVSGKAGGIGMRNYWAGAIRNIFKEIDGGEYKTWKASYSK